jgi:TRAP-type C4-dicarboxylate transport system substrate-binding protein
VHSLAVVGILALALPARAEPTVLRLASVAPEGTAYARELHAMSRDVEADTNGQVRVKWYLDGIAGNEIEVLDRIRRGQLDGAAGAAMCGRIAPTMRVLHLIGMASNRKEEIALLQRLRPDLDDEFERAGFVNLGVAPFGTFVIFSRAALGGVAALRTARIGIWDLDQVMRMQLGDVGFQVVPLRIEEMARAYERGEIDGILAPPTMALAFQWSARSRYFTQLGVPQLTACGFVTRRAFDGLSFHQQQVMRNAAAKLLARVGDMVEHQDSELLGGLFARQGLKPAPLGDEAQAQMIAAARAVRDRFDERIVPRDRLTRVLAILADYRDDARLK